jgi:diaminopimelate epimerase
MNFLLSPTLAVYKMHGCGNDFLFIDNREAKVEISRMAHMAEVLCTRKFGPGADGLVFLEETNKEGLDYIWHFYNSDGSRAEMCGNASRCAARLATALGFAGPEHVFGTDYGPIRAQVDEENAVVTVLLCKVPDVELEIMLDVPAEVASAPLTAHLCDTGVPHAVVFTADARAADIMQIGPAMRYHERFAPAGANANIVGILDRQNIIVRTYERGVEEETFACGTGAAAAVVIGRALGLLDDHVTVETSGKEELSIIVDGEDLYLKGAAVPVYTAQVPLELLGE